jgi:hypothetical protein
MAANAITLSRLASLVSRWRVMHPSKGRPTLTPDRSALLSTLAAAGHPLLELAAPGRGALLVLPYGGRVLGLFAEPGGENFFWVNPALAGVESARACLEGAAWVHSGGDRIWISPEIETHIGDLADPWGTYVVPRQVDPGHYVAERRGDTVELRNRARVTFHRRQVDCDVELERSVQLLANPLRTEPALAVGIAYAGYAQTTTLRLMDPVSAPPVSLWSLAVVPPTGHMIVPTWGPADVVDFFEPTAPERLRATPHAVHFLIDGLEQHKIGIRPGPLTGRAGYLRAAGPDRQTLLVRQWLVNPSGDYIDTPWESRAEPGYAFESYNGGAALGAFGELEYHTPAIGGGSGPTTLTDTSQLWAFSGPPAAIAAVARRLLGSLSLPAGTP